MTATIKLILFAGLAAAIALKADIGTPPLPDDIRASIDWLLTGVIAGAGAVLGPEAAEKLRSMFKPDPPTH